jgi:hypothetical protein
VITADNAGRSELADAMRQAKGQRDSPYYRAESMIAEWLHEAYEFVDPGHVSGAMTDSPILVDWDGTFVADNGQTVITESACVFWFPNYMVQCPWETLRNRGRVEFDEATPYESPVSPPVPPKFESHLPGGEREGCAVWVGDAATVQATPELARDDYAPDVVDPGLYFWREGERFGPYGAGAIGLMDLEKDGGRFWKEPAPDMRQLALFAR